MHLRSQLLFVILLGSALLSEAYAFNNKQPVTDSIRKVSIRVVALQKPKEADLDSLLLSSMPATSPKKVLKPAKKNQETSDPVNIKLASQVEPQSADHKHSVKNDSFTEPKQAQALKTDKSTVQTDAIQNIQPTDESMTFQEVKTARTYLWIGFMLIIVGIILGILFGKTALLVSIAGLVFVIIGYTI